MFLYPGAKCKIAGILVSMFPENYTEMPYAEPFVGAGCVLLRKKRSVVELVNDANLSIYCLMKAMIDGELEKKLKKMLKNTPHHQAFLNEAIHFFRNSISGDIDTSMLTDDMVVKIAYYTVVMQTMGFSGYSKNSYKSFWHSINRKMTVPIDRFTNKMDETVNRLRGVQIFSLPYDEFLEKIIKNAKTPFMIYVDPPYIDGHDYSSLAISIGLEPFTYEDHTKLAKLLKQADKKRHYFMLSIDLHEKLVDLYSGYNLFIYKSITGSLKKARYPEIIITNYEPVVPSKVVSCGVVDKKSIDTLMRLINRRRKC
ncbi:DNA adenine methylase [bacterium]|nr:DNA adenine methylase [bacterium]